jgi:hypothetical protein
MTVIARDAVAADQLVYAWPFPLGPECEVSCADDEQVVMCPGWLVGDRLGPGRHFWRTPDPTRPVSAFFVLTAPVEVSFDLTTMFAIPTTGQPVRLRACGSLQVRCVDPGLLIAQFVGLPFDRVNEGILRSVSRSVERMLARLLTRRVVMAGSPFTVIDPGMLGSIIEELVAYNPTAGAVFGIELTRMGHVTIVADDGSTPYLALPREADGPRYPMPPNGDAQRSAAAAQAAQIAQRVGEIPLLDTARGRPPPPPGEVPTRPIVQSSPEIVPLPLPSHPPPLPSHPPPLPSHASGIASGEIDPRAPRAQSPSDVAQQHRATEAPQPGEDAMQPRIRTPVPGAMLATASPIPGQMRVDATPREEPRGAILGIGMSAIGGSSVSSVSGEIAPRVAPGARVLVPGPNGLMQSATVRQLLQGYYELEVGHSGETIWVPIGGVVPER